MIKIYSIFAPNFFNFGIIFALIILKMLLPLSFSTIFSLPIFIVPYHGNPPLTKSKMLQFLSLVLVIFGGGLMIVFDGLIPILSSVFRPKSTLILSQLFELLQGKSQSPCPRLSVKAFACLDSAMSLLLNLALTIAGYFYHIFFSYNKGCSILVWLVSVDLSVVEMDI